MTKPLSVSETHVLLAGLIDLALGDASTEAERLAVLARGLRLGRILSLMASRKQLQRLLVNSERPASLDALEQVLTPRRLRLGKLTRQSQRLGAPARNRASRMSERMFPPDEVAREIGVSADAVRAWCAQGLLASTPGAGGQPQIPASALYAYRTEQARWKRLDAVSNASRAGEPPPEEAAVFAEIASRRHR